MEWIVILALAIFIAGLVIVVVESTSDHSPSEPK